MASRAAARYILPVSRTESPSLEASRWAAVPLPTAAGPSTVMTTGLSARSCLRRGMVRSVASPERSMGRAANPGGEEAVIGATPAG